MSCVECQKAKHLFAYSRRSIARTRNDVAVYLCDWAHDVALPCPRGMSLVFRVSRLPCCLLSSMYVDEQRWHIFANTLSAGSSGIPLRLVFRRYLALSWPIIDHDQCFLATALDCPRGMFLWHGLTCAHAGSAAASDASVHGRYQKITSPSLLGIYDVSSSYTRQTYS